MSPDRARLAERVALLVLIVLAVTAEPGSAAGTKSLLRFHDPVVVSVPALPGAVQSPTGALALYRVADGRLEEMPYQFDARDKAGDLDVSAARDFRLDDNDELVFMAKDTGDRAEEGALGGAGGLEIEVQDPVDGGRGWVYLLPARAAAAAATPKAPYVHFDVERRRATSALYDVEYADGRNFLTGLNVTPEAGGNGESLLRRSRMLGEPTFSLLFGDVHLSFTELNSIVRVDGVRNGPVRSVRKVQLSVDLGPLFPDLPSGTVYTLHYFSSYTTPTKMNVPWLALQALRDFRFENVLEFSPAATPERYWDAAHPDGTPMAEGAEDRTARGDHDWWAVSGPSGALLQAFIVPQEWTDWGITRGTVVRHTETAGGTPPGAAVAAGFTLRDMTRLQRSGSYGMLQSTVVLPGGYHSGDEQQVMAMFHKPLQVRVQRLAAAPLALSGR